MMSAKNTTDSPDLPDFWADPMGGQEITTSLAEYTELASRPEEFYVTKDIREFRNDFNVYLDEKKNHVAKYVLPFKQTTNDGKEKAIDFEFRPGELTVLAGENGSGKSMLLGQIGLHLMAAGASLYIASFEMSPVRTIDRMITQTVCSREKRVIEESDIDMFFGVMAAGASLYIASFEMSPVRTIDRMITQTVCSREKRVIEESDIDMFFGEYASRLHLYIASFEMSPVRTIDRMITQTVCSREKRVIEESDIDMFFGEYASRLHICDLQRKVEPDELIRLLETAVKYYRSDVLFVDSLMMCVRDDMDKQETDYVMGRLVEFARVNRVHIVVVAHCRKRLESSSKAYNVFDAASKESIKGSSNITNIAFNVFVLARDYSKVQKLAEGKEIDDKFARVNRVHIVVVAHCRKRLESSSKTYNVFDAASKESIKGSSNITNISFNVFVLARDYSKVQKLAEGKEIDDSKPG